MFAEMTDATLSRGAEGEAGAPGEAQAKAAIATFQALSSDVRGAAIIAPPDHVAAASGDPDRWGQAARALLAAADAAASSEAAHAHVATEEGEVYAVRSSGLAMVAVTDRFALSSLVLSDMRATLRSLAGAARGEAA